VTTVAMRAFGSAHAEELKSRIERLEAELFAATGSQGGSIVPLGVRTMLHCRSTANWTRGRLLGHCCQWRRLNGVAGVVQIGDVGRTPGLYDCFRLLRGTTHDPA